MKYKLALFLLVIFIVSCKSSKPVIRTTSKIKINVNKKPSTNTKTVAISTPNKDSKKDSEETLEATSSVKTYAEEVKLYIDNFKETAKNNMKQHGIPASITLAQGILESGAGKGKLAQTANNHFGIKCHTGWSGETVNHDDDADQECFRKYNHASESYRDHSLFLTSRTRYSKLFKLNKGDYKSWAKGLKEAGYATDVKYPDKFIGLIERYELYKYDNEVLNEDSGMVTNNEVLASNQEEFYTIQQGDTLYSLSKRFKVSVNELKKLNYLSENTISIGQKIRIK
jgi:flagellum-specific peptidoglycan hydrolase FlgJ